MMMKFYRSVTHLATLVLVHSNSQHTRGQHGNDYVIKPLEERDKKQSGEEMIDGRRSSFLGNVRLDTSGLGDFTGATTISVQLLSNGRMRRFEKEAEWDRVAAASAWHGEEKLRDGSIIASIILMAARTWTGRRYVIGSMVDTEEDMFCQFTLGPSGDTEVLCRQIHRFRKERETGGITTDETNEEEYNRRGGNNLLDQNGSEVILQSKVGSDGSVGLLRGALSKRSTVAAATTVKPTTTKASTITDTTVSTTKTNASADGTTIISTTYKTTTTKTAPTTTITPTPATRVRAPDTTRRTDKTNKTTNPETSAMITTTQPPSINSDFDNAWATCNNGRVHGARVMRRWDKGCKHRTQEF